MKLLSFVFLTAVTMLCAGCGKGYPGRLPDIQLSDKNGMPVSTSELTDSIGHPLMLSFYATWCDPCTKELDEFKPMLKRWKKEYGLDVYIVSIDRYPAQVPVVIETVQNKGWTDFGLLFDTDSRLMTALDVETIPTVFFIDGSGRIVHRTVGYDKDSVANAEEVLKKISNTNKPRR